MDLREEKVREKRLLRVTIINLISETIAVALPLPSKHSQSCSHLSQQSSLLCILDCFFLLQLNHIGVQFFVFFFKLPYFDFVIFPFLFFSFLFFNVEIDLRLFLLFIYLFIYLFLAVLGLRFCARAFSSCGKWGPLFIAVCRPLTIVASLVAEHRLQTRRLSSCGSRA